MKEDRWYYILGKFLKEYARTIVMFLIFCVIFSGVFYLYSLELEAVGYAILLCVCFSIVILAINYYHYLEDYRERQRVLHSIEINFEHLPEPHSLAEEDYQKMIYQLGMINNGHLTDWKQSDSESVDFYTTWVHQIKTPISVMHMILQSEDTDEHRELAGELFRIEQYVNLVLSYLRLGSNNTDFVFREYKLDSIIREAIHKYAPQFVRNRIRLSYEPTDVKVLTDEKWLSLIIEQILSNAIKYTKQGQITITVSDDKILRISDTGIGIAKEDLPRIFEKGFTGYNGRSDKKSTGLGLYLCKETANKLGIQITAESTLNVGSTFILDLSTSNLEVE